MLANRFGWWQRAGASTPDISLYYSDGTFYKEATGNPAVISGTAPTTDTYYVVIRELVLERHRELLHYPDQSAGTARTGPGRRRID